MSKLAFINSKNHGICMWYKGEFTPVAALAAQHGVEIHDEEDVWLFIDAFSNVLIEEGH